MDFPYNGSLKVQENMVVYTLQPSHSLSPLQALFGVVEEHAPSQEDKGVGERAEWFAWKACTLILQEGKNKLNTNN